MESAILQKTQLTDGDLQWMSRNFIDMTKMKTPSTKNAWFSCNYLKNSAVLKYFHHFEEKSLDSTIELIQGQIDNWNHPHILKVFDYDFNEKDPYSYRFAICQEKGLFSLRDELDKKNRLTPEDCWSLMGQLSSALLYAQSNFQTFHGNIKPSNVINFNEEKKLYKLSEFGSGTVELGKKIRILAKTQDLTQNEFLAPEYKRIPEKGENDNLNPYANDVYALGILALDALGYKVEYLRGLDPASAEALGFFNSVFTDLYNQLDYKFFNILQLMLNRDPNKRPSIEDVDNVFTNGEVPGQLEGYGDFEFGKVVKGEAFIGVGLKDIKRPKIKALKFADYDKLWSIPIREFKSVKANKWMDQKTLRSTKQAMFFDD